MMFACRSCFRFWVIRAGKRWVLYGCSHFLAPTTTSPSPPVRFLTSRLKSEHCLYRSFTGCTWGKQWWVCLLLQEASGCSDVSGRVKPMEGNRPVFPPELCNVSLQQISACYYSATKWHDTARTVAWQSSCLFCVVILVGSVRPEPPECTGLFARLPSLGGRTECGAYEQIHVDRRSREGIVVTR